MTKLTTCLGQLLNLLSVTLTVSLAGSFPSMAACYGRDAPGQQTRFKVREGEVEDLRTGLIWKRCSLGTEWNGKGDCVGEVARLGLDEATASATAGWRVPSGPELESLVDVGCGSPVVDQAIFPDIHADEEGTPNTGQPILLVRSTSTGISISSMGSQTQIQRASSSPSGLCERSLRLDVRNYSCFWPFGDQQPSDTPLSADIQRISLASTRPRSNSPGKSL